MESLNSVSAFSTNPKEILKYFNPPPPLPLLDQIDAIISDTLRVLDVVDLPDVFGFNESSFEFKAESKPKKLRKLIVDVEAHLQEMGLYGGNRNILHHMIQLELTKKFCDELVSLKVKLLQVQKIKYSFDFTASNPCHRLYADAVNETAKYNQRENGKLLIRYRKNCKIFNP